MKRPGLPHPFARLALCAAFLTLAAGCDRQPGGASVSGDNAAVPNVRSYDATRPEGVSSPNDPITTTFYIPNAAVTDLYEIESSRIALRRAKSPRVRAFAQLMIRDHERTAANLKNFVASNPVNIALPKYLDARRAAMIQNLSKASDAEFDAVYVGQQAAAHQEAMNLHKSFANRGDYPKLKSLAAAAAKLVEHHGSLIRALDREI